MAEPEPVRLEQCEVPRVPPILPAGDIALSDGCGKAARLSHYPVRQQSAAASAGHAKFLIVDVATFDGCIHARHQIFVIVTRVAILNDVPKFLSVTGTAAWIRI